MAWTKQLGTATSQPKQFQKNTNWKPNPKIESLEKRVTELEAIVTELANLLLGE